jgi:hypothetical protein
MQGKKERTGTGVSDGSCGSRQEQSGSEVSHGGKIACGELLLGI